MYQIFIWLYTLGVWVAGLFSKKVRKIWQGERESFRILKEQVDPDAKYVWFHAASLGEFEQGRPLIERIRLEHPEYKILLTFFSPSGYEVRKNYDGADIICYLPLDTIGNARRFLRLVRPVMVFFIKYEFWYNYLHIMKHRGVPTYSVSSIFRPGQVFFKWYGRGYTKVLNCFTHFFVQTGESKQLLHRLGIDEVTVVGDTRFDRVLHIKEVSKQLPLVEAFVGNEPQQKDKVFVAGSSWEPDEDIFIRYFNAHKDWKLIIAPHVIGEDHLRQIVSKLDCKVVRYSEATEESVKDAGCLIIDGFGLLSSIYHYGSVAYVGGGFGVGIHNVLEAAVWDIPVIFGPNNKRFQEAQGLLMAQGGFEVKDYEDFAAVMNLFDGDAELLRHTGSKAGHFVKNRAGAVERIMSALTSVWDHSEDDV